MAEILHQLIGGLSNYLQGFIHPRWLFGISAINSIVQEDVPFLREFTMFQLTPFSLSMAKTILEARAFALP